MRNTIPWSRRCHSGRTPRRFWQMKKGWCFTHGSHRWPCSSCPKNHPPRHHHRQDLPTRHRLCMKKEALMANASGRTALKWTRFGYQSWCSRLVATIRWTMSATPCGTLGSVASRSGRIWQTAPGVLLVLGRKQFPGMNKKKNGPPPPNHPRFPSIPRSTPLLV